MNRTKPFKTYSEQVELLRGRGMRVDDPPEAERILARLNYYRLSGYWYPMRCFTASGVARNEFKPGASFELVTSLYEFDERLRHCVFMELDRVETAVRAIVGYELGRIDPLMYLDEQKLGATAQRRKNGRSIHSVWLGKYASALRASKEQFVVHHRQRYGGELPIWAAVEVMDWGMLSHLYGMAPNIVRNRVARRCALSAPQDWRTLELWAR